MHCGVKTILYLWIMADKSPLRQKQKKDGIRKGDGQLPEKTIINKKQRDYENETISRNGRSGPDGNKHTAGRSLHRHNTEDCRRNKHPGKNYRMGRKQP